MPPITGDGVACPLCSFTDDSAMVLRRHLLISHHKSELVEVLFERESIPAAAPRAR